MTLRGVILQGKIRIKCCGILIGVSEGLGYKEVKSLPSLLFKFKPLLVKKPQAGIYDLRIIEDTLIV